MFKIPMQYFAGTPSRGHEIPTIDVSLVTVEVEEGQEIGLDTASKVGVTVQVETTDAVKLIVKGRLISQKPQVNTITGNTIVLTDNTFIPELVVILQGGTITYKTPDNPKSGVAKYEPPVAGSADKGKVFHLNCYSAIYDAAGLITGYEKIRYPNCQGVPIQLNSEDNVFRVSEYTINSAPKKGEAPYTIEYVDALPELKEIGAE